jgi:hypothetical protein
MAEAMVIGLKAEQLVGLVGHAVEHQIVEFAVDGWD